MSYSQEQPLQIGVLLCGVVQLLDLAVIDLFAILHPDYLAKCDVSQSVLDQAVPSTIHYIGQSSSAELTGSITMNITDHVSSESVAPGNLDILLIPGPDPSEVPSDEILNFVRAHHEFGTTIITICTGSQVAAYAGILDGKQAAGPWKLLPILRERFPEVKWNDTHRYVREDNIWCSGKYRLLKALHFLRPKLTTTCEAGIANGLDTVIAYMRTNFAPPVVDEVCGLAEVADRHVEFAA
ncbi:hypothetical protein LOZ58_002822 [Ophidiomyces ophidiicola]|nr:hypothetical protein LOZ58_002822 [Ophidiomyces ophidiicola]